jgi:TPP-dependent indolepyruvate ferredoxin oxidoreductase alpha subunit
MVDSKLAEIEKALKDAKECTYDRLPPTVIAVDDPKKPTGKRIPFHVYGCPTREYAEDLEKKLSEISKIVSEDADITEEKGGTYMLSFSIPPDC